jgi:polar amino acid transport system substrate-binding protein
MKKQISLLVVALWPRCCRLAARRKNRLRPLQRRAGAGARVAAIVVGLDDNFPPMGFRDEKNELVGFDIDLAKEAGKRLGAK